MGLAFRIGSGLRLLLLALAIENLLANRFYRREPDPEAVAS